MLIQRTKDVASFTCFLTTRRWWSMIRFLIYMLQVLSTPTLKTTCFQIPLWLLHGVTVTFTASDTQFLYVEQFCRHSPLAAWTSLTSGSGVDCASHKTSLPIYTKSWSSFRFVCHVYFFPTKGVAVGLR